MTFLSTFPPNDVSLCLQAARSVSIALPNCLDVDCDRHRVTNNESPLVHPIVPTHAEVVTIDLRCRYKTRSQLRALVHPFAVLLFPPGCLPLPKITNPERDGPGDASDRELANDDIIVIPDHLHLTAFEGDPGKVLHVEKVAAAEMSVALRLARPKLLRVDRYLDGGQAGSDGIEIQRALDVLESAANVRDHHVARPKLCGSMAWLECPLRHQSFPLRLRFQSLLWLRLAAGPVWELRQRAAAVALPTSDVGAVAHPPEPFQHQPGILAELPDLFDGGLGEPNRATQRPCQDLRRVRHRSHVAGEIDVAAGSSGRNR